MPESPSSKKSPAVAVIGAGIAGLSCARALAAAGLDVVVLEKSRGLGGRCATRRWEGHIVDHGAQYFTMRDEEFRREVATLCGDHLRAMDLPILDADTRPVVTGGARWYHARGNNRLGRALLGDLPGRMETLVSRAEPRDGAWWIGDEKFAAVVSSAPLPQTLALLGRKTDPDLYAPCLTAFFAYSGEDAGNSAEAYARVDAASDLAWSACENHKAGRVVAGQTVFVAQASPGFSAAFFEADPREWAGRLRASLEARWELPRDAARATFTHRWRFARYVAPEPAVLTELPPGFFVTGDALRESRVESAWIAGRATARDVVCALQRR